MKRIFTTIIILSIFIFTGCDKDECECFYSDYYKQYVPNKSDHDATVSGDILYSQEQLDALAAQCRADGC